MRYATHSIPIFRRKLGMTSQTQPIDSVLRMITRELWIVTASAAGRRGGLTATWVSAASIDPEQPMLLIGIAENHFTRELIAAAGSFAVHLLRPDQGAIAWNFAHDSGGTRDKFAGLKVREGVTGSPVLADCLAWLEARVVGEYSAGDRHFFWGEVIAGESLSQGPALTDQAWFGTLSAEQKQHLLASRTADIAVQRPLQAAWRQANLSE